MDRSRRYRLLRSSSMDRPRASIVSFSPSRRAGKMGGLPTRTWRGAEEPAQNSFELGAAARPAIAAVTPLFSPTPQLFGPLGTALTSALAWGWPTALLSSSFFSTELTKTSMESLPPSSAYASGLLPKTAAYPELALETWTPCSTQTLALETVSALELPPLESPPLPRALG